MRALNFFSFLMAGFVLWVPFAHALEQELSSTQKDTLSQFIQMLNHSPSCQLQEKASTAQATSCKDLGVRVIKDEKYISFVEPKCSQSLFSVAGIKVGDRIEGKGVHLGVITAVDTDPFGIESVKKKTHQELMDNLSTYTTTLTRMTESLEKKHETSADSIQLLAAFKQEVVLLGKMNFEEVLQGKSKLPLVSQNSFLDQVAHQACVAWELPPSHYRMSLVHPDSILGSDLGLELAQELAPKALSDCVRELRSQWAETSQQMDAPLKAELKKPGPTEIQLSIRNEDVKLVHLLRYRPEEGGCKKVETVLGHTDKTGKIQIPYTCSTWSGSS